MPSSNISYHIVEDTYCKYQQDLSVQKALLLLSQALSSGHLRLALFLLATLQKSVVKVCVNMSYALKSLLLGAVGQVLQYQLQVSYLLHQQKVVHFHQGLLRLLDRVGQVDRSHRLPASFGTLILNLPFNITNQLRLFLHEARVVVVVVSPSSFFRETVHIQLSYVGVHIFVLKVGRQNVESECSGIGYDKAVLLIVPVNNVLIFRFLDRGILTDSIW